MSSKDLKLRANEAKKRLASGYFQKNECIINKQVYHTSGVDYLDEERMYKIVMEIVDSDEVVINPLGRLMNKEYFESLDYASRQRYIFKLSEIYIKLKKRYLREKVGEM